METKTTIWTRDELKAGGKVYDAANAEWTIKSVARTGRTRREKFGRMGDRANWQTTSEYEVELTS